MSRKLADRIRSLLFAIGLLSVVVVVVIGGYAAVRFLPDRPVTYDTMEEHFKYGSTGGDRVTGIPVWLWQAMPLVCADTLEQVAGDRLAADYVQRASEYSSATSPEAYAQRRALSREGYKALGFLYEADAEGQERSLPVGISERRSLGLDRAYMNCAICHTGTVRGHADDEPQVVVGMPANQFSLYDFEQFIFQCGMRGRYTQLPQLDFIPEMAALGADLSLVDQYLVYPVAIWAIEDTLHFLQNVAGFAVRQPDWGPGRNDTFTNNKVFLYGYDWRKEMPDWWTTGQVDPEGIGIVDWPSTWLQGQRKSRADGQPMQLHWDGNNNRVEERNLNAALATSALPAFIDHESLECVEQWMDTLEPPVFPFGIDQALADQGEEIYGQYCAACHGVNGRDFSGDQVGFVTPIEQVATDRYRLDNYTAELALNMATTYAGADRQRRAHPCPGGATYVPPGRPDHAPTTGADNRMKDVDVEENTYRYKHYRKTHGYANSPLDGIWLRAPYLHNVSVPTLRDLLNPVAQRPVTFYRGNDVYEPVDMGFVSTVAQSDDGNRYFLFDTRVPGNGNQGHEGRIYGTELTPADKNALLEYLKSF
jgi:cytochrome c553